MTNPKGFVLQFNYCRCKGCDDTLKKVRSIDGVHSIDIDETKRELTISGPVEPKTVIKMLKDGGKLAKLLRKEEESPPQINHQEMQIVVQQQPIQIDRRKVFPQLPGLISEPVDRPMEIEIHHGDPKHVHELEKKTYNKPFRCDKCREHGYRSGYRCKHCIYDLHEDCRNPKAKITHELFKGSIFKYCQKTGKNCDACGLEIHGHSYSCREDKLDLHPACSKLRGKLCIQGTDFLLCKKAKYKCFWCKMEKPSWLKVPGLWYVSEPNKFSCHVHCVSLVMQEAWKRRGLDPNHDDDDDGISKALEKVDLKLVAKAKGSGGKGGGLFLGAVTIFIKTIIGILFGDPSGLIVSALTLVVKELPTL